jgi:uncharacterized protein (DUF952 family)
VTADRFFNKETELLVQRIKLDDLKAHGGEIKWEAAGKDVFPHWYIEPLEGALDGLGEVLERTRSVAQTWQHIFWDM